MTTEYDNAWSYKGKEFNSDDIGDAIGFVYIITDPNGMKYIGKKLFHKTVKMPPLKGKTRKRKKVTESDWKKYYGSSDNVKALVEEHGANNFKREILHLCKFRGELSYMELKEQMERDVLFKPDEYHNAIIQVRINRSHVLGKMNEQ